MHMLAGNDILRGRANARAVFDHRIARPQGPQGEFVTEGDVPGGRDVPVAGLPEQAAISNNVQIVSANVQTEAKDCA